MVYIMLSKVLNFDREVIYLKPLIWPIRSKPNLLPYLEELELLTQRKRISYQ